MLKPILTAGATLLALTAPVFADGDAAKGEKVFNKCKACHEVGEDAKNKVGPSLNGIIGAAAGQNADFKYSSALTEMAEGGLVWDEESMTAFLTKPRDFMKGTKMTFAGLRKEQEVKDVIAYLATFQ
jgi:cytochrome c